jgi:hypothetical protein
MDSKQAKQVAKKAEQFFKSIYTDSSISDIEVEEIEFSPAGDVWYVTIGFSKPAPSHSPQMNLYRLTGGELDPGCCGSRNLLAR